MKPDGIILGTDRRQRAGAADRAGRRRRHQGRRLARRRRARADRRHARRCSPTSRPIPLEVAKACGPLRGRGFSSGTARRHPVHRLRSTPSPPPRRTPRRRPSKAARAARCWRSSTRRSATSPTAWASSRRRCCRSTARTGPTRSPSTTSTTTSRRPSLQAAGVDPANGYPRKISAGDGSVPAFQRIRDKQYQFATVAEPLNLHGWHMIDEMNRAFAGEKPSGYVPHVAPLHRRRTRQGRRHRRTSSIPATATATSTRRSGACK